MCRMGGRCNCNRASPAPAGSSATRSRPPSPGRSKAPSGFTGCRRVNVGTAALENPEWTARAIAAYGDRVAIGLDVRGERLAARGWTREGGDLWEVLARLDSEGCARYVVTDVNKDGMLAGPNLDLLAAVAARTNAPLVASGGVSTLADIAAIRDLVGIGVEGAIIGSALYKNAFTLPDALDVAGRP